MKLLKKSDILNGINDPKQIEIKSLGGALWLRPLSNSELDDLDEMEAKAMGNFETNEKGSRRGVGETTSKGRINVAKVTRASADVKIEMIYRSLDNPKNVGDDSWSYDEINSLKRQVVDEIVEKVKELSGENVTKGELERFPENEGS